MAFLATSMPLHPLPKVGNLREGTACLQLAASHI